MASANLEELSSKNEIVDVTLALEDDKIQAHKILLATSNRSINNQEIEEVKDSDSEVIDKIKVKYCLNKVKNLEEAKANATRPVKIQRLTTNDTNIRYKINSGQYLHIKDEMRMYKKDNTETSEDGNVTIKVEKTSAVEDQDENNPESQIKMMISNKKKLRRKVL